MAKTAVRFKESVAEYERLRKEIAARRFAPIYLLMGEEGYFIDSLCDALASTILTPAEQSFNQITVYGKDILIAEKKCGRAVGSFSFKKISFFVAP